MRPFRFLQRGASLLLRPGDLPRFSGHLHLSLFLLAAVGLQACQTQATVTRRKGAVEERGRVISPDAYASFARGIVLERRGAHRQAEAAYRGVLHIDPKSGAAWAALVRVVCRDSASSASALARRAERHADRPALSFVSLGECLLEGDAPRAEELAHEALSHEPELDSARSLLRDARRLLRDADLTQRAEDGGEGSRPPVSHGVSALDAVDAALMRGDLEAAQLRATGRLFSGELALRAWALGQDELARKQTQFALRLQPADADACLTLQLLKEETDPADSDEPAKLALPAKPSKAAKPTEAATPKPLASASEQSLCWESISAQDLSDLALLAFAARLAPVSSSAAQRILTARALDPQLERDAAARGSLLYLDSWQLAPRWKGEALFVTPPSTATIRTGLPELGADAALPASGAHPEGSAEASGPR